MATFSNLPEISYKAFPVGEGSGRESETQIIDVELDGDSVFLLRIL